jgi:hypothetical protein
MSAEQALKVACESKDTASESHSRAPRHGLIRLATLRWNGEALPVRLRNISTGGALLESERALDPGAGVELDLPGCGMLPAEVRWSQSGRLGISFLEEFDLKKLAPPKKRGGSNVKVLKPAYLEQHESVSAPTEQPKAKDLRRF